MLLLVRSAGAVDDDDPLTGVFVCVRDRGKGVQEGIPPASTVRAARLKDRNGGIAMTLFRGDSESESGESLVVWVVWKEPF